MRNTNTTGEGEGGVIKMDRVDGANLLPVYILVGVAILIMVSSIIIGLFFEVTICRRKPRRRRPLPFRKPFRVFDDDIERINNLVSPTSTLQWYRFRWIREAIKASGEKPEPRMEDDYEEEKYIPVPPEPVFLLPRTTYTRLSAAAPVQESEPEPELLPRTTYRRLSAVQQTEPELLPPRTTYQQRLPSVQETDPSEPTTVFSLPRTIYKRPAVLGLRETAAVQDRRRQSRWAQQLAQPHPQPPGSWVRSIVIGIDPSILTPPNSGTTNPNLQQPEQPNPMWPTDEQQYPRTTWSEFRETAANSAAATAATSPADVISPSSDQQLFTRHGIVLSPNPYRRSHIFTDESTSASPTTPTNILGTASRPGSASTVRLSRQTSTTEKPKRTSILRTLAKKAEKKFKKDEGWEEIPF
ncbi:hypothetical protein B0H66DRAFT_617654 [Apodospora peruviana]|uniref:Uncharacterized protein n=1 Tax=Apodospora peruviana TaxID=516989 RepID=A0AAE0IKS3_9PEZI|nr:hypothetical protein B0H66DRAFT_617654 [Apodospora peruviana]